jgi:hypothetical protein
METEANAKGTFEKPGRSANSERNGSGTATSAVKK